MLKSLVCDGIIAGVGSVLVFLPQIMILFLFIILLEDVGYMARAAFLLDKIMGGAGLHGRAFIPLLSSFACAIPGIMATRVIDNQRDRLTTILVAPLMTCSARIPVYTLIISAFVPGRGGCGRLVSLQGLVIFGLYATGPGQRPGRGWVMRRVFWRGVAEPFLMELPAYKAPDPMNVSRNVPAARADLPAARRHHHPVDDGAGLVSVDGPGQAGRRGRPGDRLSASPASSATRSSRILAPVGFSWQMSVALIPGMAAREVAVGALGTVYAVSGGDGGARRAGRQSWRTSGRWPRPWRSWPGTSSPRNAPRPWAWCKRETNSWRWPIDHVRLHDRAGLCGGLHRLSVGPGAGGRVR